MPTTRRHVRDALAAGLLVVLASSCGPALSATSPPPGDEVKSDHARILSAAPAADLAATVLGNTNFALDVMREVGRDDQNLFFSPQSITLALAMTMAGARGSTQTAFEKTLHLGLFQSAYHRAMNDLDRQLESRGQNAKAADGSPFQLRLTNQLFTQKGGAFEPAFLDLLAEEYGASGRALDFIGNPERERGTINAWVASETEQRIPEVLAKGSVDASTRLVLVNAIYFNASWARHFQASRTADGVFHAPHVDRLVPLMHSDKAANRYGQLDGIQVVELPYDGGELSLVVVLPRVGELAAFEHALDAAKLQALLDALEDKPVELTMPSFLIKGDSISLRGPLGRLGLEEAFGPSADLSGINTHEPLELSDVWHQAFVKVDESGTEAAAASAVGATAFSAAPTPIPVVLDRPFLFLVRDNATGAVVFLGHLVSP